MTVDMSTPLPAFQIEIRARHRQGTVPVSAVARIAYSAPASYADRMTLAHLVQVLVALTDEQLCATVASLSQEQRLTLLGEGARSLCLFHCERADAEKSRADRAEQRVRELEESASMACIEPDSDCVCAGCAYARDVHAKELETK